MLKLQQGPHSSFELRGPCLCWGPQRSRPYVSPPPQHCSTGPSPCWAHSREGRERYYSYISSYQSSATVHTHCQTPLLMRIHGPQEQHPSRSPSVPNNRRSPLTHPFLAQAKQRLRGAGQKEAWIVFDLRQNLALRGRERGTTRHRNTPRKKEPD